MTAKLISIIIPLYNAENYIAEAIDSVIEQTYTNWELLIIDDCSTDNSREVVKQYSDKSKKIVLYESEYNAGGPSKPRNIGLEKAKGEYIAFLDSDDIWYPDKLRTQMKILLQNTDFVIVGTNAETFPKRFRNKLMIRRNMKLSFEDLIKSNKIITSSVLMRKSIIENIGYFDEKLLNTQDYDYWLRVLDYKDDSTFVLKETLIKYRLHTKNISLYNDKTKKGYYDLLLYIYKKYPQKISTKKINYLQENKDYLNQLLTIKRAYYRGQITMKYLFKNKTVHFKDKLLIAIKKPILHFLQQIP